ncbi:MAG: hypothetical protein IJT76_03440 [Clostridia bacterium]|nr:hypothetical protein [Clostridia bacterium]
MIVIACEKRGDLPWLRQLIQSKALSARPAERGERWDILVDQNGNVRCAGQVLTCGLDGRSSLSVSSLLQEGGMAALQREMYTMDGALRRPREIPLAGLPGTLEQRMAGAAVLLFLGKI